MAIDQSVHISYGDAGGGGGTGAEIEAGRRPAFEEQEDKFLRAIFLSVASIVLLAASSFISAMATFSMILFFSLI